LYDQTDHQANTLVQLPAKIKNKPRPITIAIQVIDIPGCFSVVTYFIIFIVKLAANFNLSD